MNNNESNVEELIEQLTKVRPEMLNEEALKLFNTIMAVLDERDKLKETNKKQADIIATANIAIKDLQEKLKEYVPISKIEDEIEELEKDKKNLIYGSVLIDAQIGILKRLMEDK